MTKLTAEEQIEKDREAIARMIGAKSAMEAAIREIERLKQTISLMSSAHQDCMKAVGEGAYVNAYRDAYGRPNGHSATVRVGVISGYIRELEAGAK